MYKRKWKLFIEDWKGMVGFRNRIVHAYFEIGLSIVMKEILEKEE